MKMKKHDASMIKKGILLSLVLLSPEILAAENLNFNYTRADASSLDPRLSKLAQACHTLTDTMDINVLFGEMNTQNVRVTMTVYGKNAGKGYSAVYSLPGTSGKSATDPDLVVPWSLTFKGAASLTVEQTSTTPVTDTAYDDPFCFSLKTPQGNSIYANSNKMPPIYSQPPYAKGYSRKDFDKYCWNFNRVNPDNMEDTYWPNYDERPDVIAKGMAKPWDEYQGKYMFHRHKYSYDTGATEQHSDWSNIEHSVDAAGGSSAVPGVVNEFPIYQKGAANSVLRNGKFLIKLNNRNVTRLILDINYTDLGAHSIFTWKRDGGYLSNVLAFKGVKESVAVMSAGDIQNDPYQPFYNDGGKGKKAYFRGTLVEDGSLNQKYKDYIKNIMPLSLPPTYRGDINLVNTHSLTFKIGSVNGSGAGGSTTVTVYGQPLKFGPLYSADKEAASAMQVRNACY